MRSLALAALAFLSLPCAFASAQRPTLSVGTRSYVAVDTPVVALTHARVIDGTGAAARADQTLIIRDGTIAALGDSRGVAVPAGALVMDLTGKSVMPGLVMVHEHLFYPTGPGVYGNLSESFTRLYLAGGVTSMRTAGNMNGFTDIGIKRDIDAGRKPGPWLDATAPYLEGLPGLGLMQVHDLTGADDARRMVNFWADAGATSFKTYMHITRAELAAVIETDEPAWTIQIHPFQSAIAARRSSLSWAAATRVTQSASPAARTGRGRRYGGRGQTPR